MAAAPSVCFRALGLALGLAAASLAAPAPLEVLEDEPARPAAPAPAKPPADTLKAAAPAAPDSAASDTAATRTTADTSRPADTARAAAPAIPAEPDPDAITVEVDPAQSVNKDKSLALAMFSSAVLPGTGELYLREQGNAKAFLLAEAGFWASLYVALMARESYLTSARNHASEYAGIDASGKSSAFLETMATFRSYQEKQHRQDSYELAQILSGKRDRDYPIKPVEANYWDFGSSANPENTRNWKAFQSTLRYYRASKVAMSFAIGALALNRLASLANTLRVYRGTSSRGLGLQLSPDFGPESAGALVSLRF